jgi:hypothetical protein
VVDFVHRVNAEGVPADERVAVFDNDGTLWCEKPMPMQLDFILRRLVAMAQARPELQVRQPWQAAYERDYGWFAQLMADLYAGDDSNVRTLVDGIPAAFEGITVEDFEAESGEFLRSAKHPTLGPHRNPSGSGAGPVGAPCWQRATPTATSPCSTSPTRAQTIPAPATRRFPP